MDTQGIYAIHLVYNIIRMYSHDSNSINTSIGRSIIESDYNNREYFTDDKSSYENACTFQQ